MRFAFIWLRGEISWTRSWNLGFRKGRVIFWPDECQLESEGRISLRNTFEIADKMRVMFSSGIKKIMWTEVNVQFIRTFHVIWSPSGTLLPRPLRYHPAAADRSGLLPISLLIAFLNGVHTSGHCFTGLASGIRPSGDTTRFVSTQQGYFVGWTLTSFFIWRFNAFLPMDCWKR
jgi:hypothetical protein